MKCYCCGIRLGVILSKNLNLVSLVSSIERHSLEYGSAQVKEQAKELRPPKKQRALSNN